MSQLFVPGPVDVAPEVLKSQAQAMLPHRSQEFEAIYRNVSNSARALFYTQFRVFLSASSGTGWQEAAVRNLARENMLSCINGAFSKRWYEVARSNGKKADKLEAPWDHPIDPDAVYKALKEKSYDLLTVVHNETSTGLCNPVKEIAAAAHDASPETLICVDAVSSLGGAKIDMDAWSLDVVFTSSQKCLALPPGLGLAAVSDRALAQAEGVPNRGWYFDLLRMEKHRLKDSTPATPALSLIYALAVQLDRIFAEGLEARFTRHSEMAQRVQTWALENNLGIYAPPEYRSQTVTTIKNNLNIDYTALNEHLMQYDMRIANGYGPLKGDTFRIAHMGETQLEDIDRLLEVMSDYILSIAGG